MEKSMLDIVWMLFATALVFIMQAGKLDLEIIDFDLSVTLDEVGDFVAIKAHDKGLEYVCMVHHGMPSLLCRDPGRLRRILVNLVGNAIKFTDYGEVATRVSIENENTTHTCNVT